LPPPKDSDLNSEVQGLVSCQLDEVELNLVAGARFELATYGSAHQRCAQGRKPCLLPDEAAELPNCSIPPLRRRSGGVKMSFPYTARR
jgi:hypothetical protein